MWDLGENASCNKCKKRYCSCPERYGIGYCARKCKTQWKEETKENNQETKNEN